MSEITTIDNQHPDAEAQAMPIYAALSKVSIAAGVLAGWLVVPLVLTICYDVAARYLFNSATIWAYEIGYMLTGANFLLAIAYVTYEGGHIRVDILYDRLSERGQRLVDLFTYGCIVVPFSLWASWSLYFYFLDAWQTGEGTGQSAWNPPLWPFRLVYFISFALLALQSLLELAKRISALRYTGSR